MKSPTTSVAASVADRRPLLSVILSAWATKAFSYFPQLVGCVLLAAAVAKAHALATDSVLASSFWNSRWFLTCLVLVELALGLWLWSGLHPRWSRVATFCFFFAFADFNFYLALRGEACPCLGKLHTPPWTMVLLDVGVLFGLATWVPAGSRQSSFQPGPRRLYAFVILYALVAAPTCWTMIDYGHQGVGLDLRVDGRLQRVADLDLKNPGSEDILAPLAKASGLTFTIDERLSRNPPEYGRIGPTTSKIWSAMMFVAQEQRRPARWDQTADGYHLQQVGLLGSRLTPWFLSAGLGTVLLSVATVKGLRRR